LQQILPLTKCGSDNNCHNYEIKKSIKDRREGKNQFVEKFPWQTLANIQKKREKPIEIEPGEYDELDFEFIIESNIKLIRVYSFFLNQHKRENEIGWSISDIYSTSNE